MRVRLAYGSAGLDIDVDPAVTTVVEPVYQRAVADPGAELRAALRHPVARRCGSECGQDRQSRSQPATVPVRSRGS